MECIFHIHLQLPFSFYICPYMCSKQDCIFFRFNPRLFSLINIHRNIFHLICTNHLSKFYILVSLHQIHQYQMSLSFLSNHEFLVYIHLQTSNGYVRILNKLQQMYNLYTKQFLLRKYLQHFQQLRLLFFFEQMAQHILNIFKI